jgi:hypothetical protein
MNDPEALIWANKKTTIPFLSIVFQTINQTISSPYSIRRRKFFQCQKMLENDVINKNLEAVAKLTELS